jgi:hypothetical protein
VAAVDATAPPPDPPPGYVYGPTDFGPRGQRETELCNKASTTDWLYLTGLVLANVGSVYLSTYQIYKADSSAVRHIGPALIGLSWGGLLGGGYLALPKCDRNWVRFPPREGDARSSVPLALAIASLAAATAPFVTGIATVNRELTAAEFNKWSSGEHFARGVVSGAFAFGGALLPYLLPPKTWSAAKELERIRVTGTYIGYTVAF